MAAYLPLAICMLACPFIMIIMMKGMGSKDSPADAEPGRAMKLVRGYEPRGAQVAELKAQSAALEAKQKALKVELQQAESGALQTEPSKESVV